MTLDERAGADTSGVDQSAPVQSAPGQSTLVESPPAGNGDAQNPFKEGSNPFKDVQNILGFLLAGFGGIISFLGLQSAEVTTVLRNDPAQASGESTTISRETRRPARKTRAAPGACSPVACG